MIRVAFDFSFLGQHGSNPPPTTGAGRVIIELGRELQKRDDVKLVGVGFRGHDAFPMLTSLQTETYVSNLAGGVSVQRAFRSRTGFDWFYGPRLISAGREQFRAPSARISRIRRLLNRLLLKFSNYDCRSGLSAERFDVFHATFNALPDRREIPGIGRVQMIYDTIPALFPEDVGPHVAGWFSKVMQNLDKERDVVVAISHATKADFCAAAGFDPERVFVAPLAAGPEFKPCQDPEDRAKVRVRYGIPEGDFILCVANPQPRKNLPFLVRGFFQVAAQNPSWKGSLVLAGNAACGWGMEQVDAAIAKLRGFGHRVVVTGSIKDEDLPILYSECLIFAFPSLYEGFGLPPLEAMACGAPVVCSDRSSLPEVVGGAALTASPVHEEDFAGAMSSLLNDSGKRRELSRAGRARAREFSWRASANCVVEAYAAAAEMRHR